MNNEQLLQAISDMIDQKLEEKLDQKLDEKLKPVYMRLDRVESRLDSVEVKQDRTIRKLDDFQLDTKVAERTVSRNIHRLQDEMETVIEVLKLNKMVYNSQPDRPQTIAHVKSE